MRFLVLALLVVPLTACNLRLTEDGGFSVAPAREEAPLTIAAQPDVPVIDNPVVVETSVQEITQNSKPVCTETFLQENQVWELAKVSSPNTALMSGTVNIMNMTEGDEIHRIRVKVYPSCDRWWEVNHARTGTRGWVDEKNVRLLIR